MAAPLQNAKSTGESKTRVYNSIIAMIAQYWGKIVLGRSEIKGNPFSAKQILQYFINPAESCAGLVSDGHDVKYVHNARYKKQIRTVRCI